MVIRFIENKQFVSNKKYMIMKKVYISPLTAVFAIHTSAMIAGTTLDPNNPTPTVTPDPDEKIDGGFGSRRRRDVWDEEEDEDF